MRVTTTEAAVSTIHSTHASMVAQYPHFGTQIKIHISINVAKPMGQVARYNGSTGSSIIMDQARG